ncbi:MAG: c-type cytochrome domain-containing protein [Nitrosomonadales bacterium]
MKIEILLCGAMLAAISLNAPAETVAPNQAATGSAVPGEISFKRDVQPILHDYCVNCHEPGGKGYVKSGLDLTSYQGTMKGTKFGAVVIPGNSDVSTFTKLLTGIH